MLYRIYMRKRGAYHLIVITYSIKFPCILHHLCEVLIRIDGSRDLAEVVRELFECDDSVGDLSVPLFHKLQVNLLRLFFAADHVRVLGDIVYLRDVV